MRIFITLYRDGFKQHHGIIDIFVIYGMLSPCPQGSLMTGLAWYEINSTLYWDKTFLL
ncbi:MAG: hypothetical protein JRE28_05125 [Deltaproteobacteria bacterium]|nr:hypothetical protein [Deltaproteobacteria bacterium]